MNYWRNINKMSEFPMGYIHFQSKCIAECFVRSSVFGIDSDDFCKKFLTSEWGKSIFNDGRLYEYSDANYMFEGLQINLDLIQGEFYDRDVLWTSGYLYKYWASTRNIPSDEMYKLAPIQCIANRYAFYHTQDWDYVINDIIASPYKWDKEDNTL